MRSNEAGTEKGPDDLLDPDVRRFNERVGAAFARYPDFSQRPVPERRRIAEEVRAPWTVGGPQMHARIDRTIPTRCGDVRVRLHDPSPSAHKAALIYLHGGGWTMFSIDTHDRLMREYAGRAGIVVMGVDYALAPEAKFPVALNQVVDVVRWTRAHATDLGLDASRVALGGDSAGANLTLTACLALRDAGERDAVKGMVLNYGAFDREVSETAARDYGYPGSMLEPAEMEQFWENYLRNATDASNPLACPLRADLAGLPPAFLAIAERDILAEQSIAMTAKLRAAGVDAHSVSYAGASHSFLEAVSIAALSDRALADTAAWLRSRLR